MHPSAPRYAASTSALTFAPSRFSATAKSYWLCKFSQSAPSALEPSAAIIGLTFARERNRQFVAANLMQKREIGLSQLPHHGRCDVSVVVAQHIADARHFLPRDFGMARFQFVREMAARLGNDLDAALDQPLPLPVRLERFERYFPQHPANAFDRFGDVSHAKDERPGVH